MNNLDSAWVLAHSAQIGIGLGSMWEGSGVSLGSFSDRCGIGSESIWDRLQVGLGLAWRWLGIALGLSLGSDFIGDGLSKICFAT